MKDPYTILGVARDASDEDIKKAYRTLARKYHPDNYADSGLADLAEEKMKEINEAYDAIQKMRAGTSSDSYGAGGAYNAGSAHTSGDFARVRQLFNMGHFSDAELILNATPQSERGAEWNFLKGCVLLQRGYLYDAQKYIDTACYLDPSNQEYAAAKQRLRSQASGYGSPYTTTQYGSGCSGSDLCTSLICADCLCECCGGDLIRCC
ncbi:MAG: J domain-containing protein [Clostridia bacterium]|nr:J domain-containing protein [Clostridia bacterium]